MNKHTLILKTLKCKVLWVICQFDEYLLFDQLAVACNLEIKDKHPSMLRVQVSFIAG